MKKLSTLLFAGVMLLTGSVANAQSAEEIVKKHNEAIGGIDAWKKVSSIVYTGSMNAQGQEIGVVVSMLDGKGVRQDISIMGMANYIISTPTAGWMFFPVQGQTKPEPLTADLVKEGADDLFVMDPLTGAETQGSKIELIGKDDVDGTECFKLKVTSKSGNVKTAFVDPATFYIIRETEKQKADGKEQEVISNYGNFTKLTEGIVVPMSLESNAFGAIKFTKAEINTIKDDSIFKPSTGG